MQNHFKDTSGQGFYSLHINGVYFPVYKDVSFVSANTKTGDRRINTFMVFVSPDYNPCANYRVEARSMSALAKKLAKLDYRIVKPITRY